MRTDDILYDFWWACFARNYSMPLCRIAFEAGGARRLYGMEEKQLVRLKGISEECAQEIIRHRETFDLKEEYRRFVESGARFIPYYSAEFPERLRRISGHPFAIFVKGRIPPENRPSVALVGARNCSEYGRKAASDLATALAGYGIPVVSGMALGIDGTAQMACLNAGGESFGVLGSGVDVCYPAANRVLYERLCEQGGIISEYGPGTKPKACLFPARNRIIAALSDVVVVVEAREKSGTGITVDMALEQGKDVAIVPGRITDPLSRGCIQLWKQGAVPVTSAEDIMEIIRDNFPLPRPEHAGETARDNCSAKEELLRPPSGADAKAAGILTGNRKELTGEEEKLYAALDYYAKSAEQLCQESALNALGFMSAVMKLQVKGYAKELGKDFFVKI
ncbi:MAG: DNA-processing protein DprA [Lachnospiraceae bacterium]|nr:DNA-processing protein DprA [Lachnospiraceae bacterium]